MARKKRGKKRPRRIIAAKRGGFLPALLALASLAPAIATAVSTIRRNRAQVQELRNHHANLEAAKGKGAFLRRYKRGSGLKKKGKKDGGDNRHPVKRVSSAHSFLPRSIHAQQTTQASTRKRDSDR